jgi:hypothetical protein
VTDLLRGEMALQGNGTIAPAYSSSRFTALCAAISCAWVGAGTWA